MKNSNIISKILIVIIDSLKRNKLTIFLLFLNYTISNMLFGYICPSMIIIGVPCPGCGLTRAAISLLMLDFKQAFLFNPMIFLLLPLIIAYIVIKAIDSSKIGVLFYPSLFAILLSIVVFILRIKTNWGSEPFIINDNALIFTLAKYWNLKIITKGVLYGR